MEDKYVGDRHYTFHYEVADKNFTAAWTKVAATRLLTSTAAKAMHPRVLTIWGASDWFVDRASSAWIGDRLPRPSGTLACKNATSPRCAYNREPLVASLEKPHLRTRSEAPLLKRY